MFREWWPKAWELWVIIPVISGLGDLLVGCGGVCPNAPATDIRDVPVPTGLAILSFGTAFSRRGAPSYLDTHLPHGEDHPAL